jgi:hypothetical protein
MMRTWQTRLVLGAASSELLDAYAAVYGKAERSLFADLAAGKQSKNELKRAYLIRFGITARQFNALRIGLEGKIRSIQERQPDLIKEMAQRITRAKTTIVKLRTLQAGDAGRRSQEASSGVRANKIHQKMRRLDILERK